MSLPEQTGYKLIGDIDTDGKKVQNLPAPSSDGEAVRATTKITESNLEDAVDKKHSQNTDVALRTDKLTVDASGNTEIVGELKIKVYSQDAEPTLGADQRLAIWIDTDDSNKVYLIFRRGTDDQVSVELS